MIDHWSLAYSQGQPWFGAAAEDRNGTVTLIDLARESVQTSKTRAKQIAYEFMNRCWPPKVIGISSNHSLATQSTGLKAIWIQRHGSYLTYLARIYFQIKGFLENCSESPVFCLRHFWSVLLCIAAWPANPNSPSISQMSAYGWKMILLSLDSKFNCLSITSKGMPMRM